MEAEEGLTINKAYAARYTKRKQAEELSKRKEFRAVAILVIAVAFQFRASMEMARNLTAVLLKRRMMRRR